MQSQISIKNYIHTVRNYLKKEEANDSKAPKSPENSEIFETFTSSSTGMELILIPADEFEMGSLSEEKDRSDYECPTHRVIIKNPYYIGKYPVSQKQWKKIMGKNPSHFKGEDRPVEMVSWNEVQKFVKKLNENEGTDKYRLPSEAEWEYACRAGSKTKYYFGNEWSKLNEYAWYAENSGSHTHPIGQKRPNSWGLYDMHGNVWEWVQDKWYENCVNSPADGSTCEDESSSYRVSRGGSWFCDAELCRSTSRFKRDPENYISNLGFRILREL